ncbi:heavy-metal-associated domain-containing protein [Pseudotenacibaculum haliotis]|uniref:Heavy-metal-associated domain-containing protein n=1 Tax=Pseudotenacibaculum haliotis TaxID=1862138 RepID=A0ABW5LUS5_9FLAO
MKKVILSLAVIAAIGFTSCKSEAKKEEKKTETVEKKKVAYTDASFGVRGNCGMCKSTIEKAVNSIDGISKADWDRTRKKIDVSFDASKTNLDEIHKAIANSGYDTDKLMGSEDAYKNLPGCCKYDHSMEMNLKGNVKDDGNSGH